MLHAKAIAIATAFDIYKELAEGNVKKEWQIDVAVDFYRFREKLAAQCLSYSPKHRLYPGDEKFRVSTQQSKTKRALPNSPFPAVPRTPRTAASASSSETSGITQDDVKDAKETGRLCGDLNDLIAHYHSLQRLPNGNKKVCSVCGVLCQHLCGKCGKAVHHPKTTNDKVKHPCFMQWHNTMFFGLAKDDFKLVGAKKKDYEQPSDERVLLHSVAMQRMRAETLQKRPPALTTPADPSSHITPLRKRKRLVGSNSNSNSSNGFSMTDKDKKEDGWNSQCV
jgi:hypothetical protein